MTTGSLWIIFIVISKAVIISFSLSANPSVLTQNPNSSMLAIGILRANGLVKFLSNLV